MADKTYKIGISGSYGGMNLGDEAILQSIIAQIRSSIKAEITVFSRVARDTKDRHDIEKVVDVRNLSINEIKPEIASLDVFILGGGGLLYDADVKFYLREVKIAQELGIPTMLYAIGAGPLNNAASQSLVADVLNHVDAITVRDVDSRHLLESLGVKAEITVTADPAFLIRPEPLPEGTLIREQLTSDKPIVGMSVRELGVAAPDLDMQKYHMLLANAADFMVDRFNADIVFVPTERKNQDIQLSHAVISQMLKPHRAHVLKGKYTPGQLLNIMGHFQFAVGMRLHFLIFAALQNVPFVALPYASKVKGLLGDLGLDMPPIELVNAGRLIAHLDHSWDLQGPLREQIQEKLPSIQQRSKRSNTLLLDLLKKHSN
ncbi:polysaccharide pyruvyl transferase family protein [Olivibacter sitiensis]|uniref:polysaccharide pyruvyl transferase family protein n=1 Tax=Olivibacter sitiensis TaxID=376470 RepID=UPI00041C67A7|nr:polysaccharide pyruvyl transferase family protein [Olivibacter sitiensis]